uniref:N-acetyltransferase domain-containing protein n=1 Tax=Grammatophora oceanica TaxID=210454 RepID=A0A7S1UZ18_9STRA|mmetsp:Transcript_3033/g.4169  ORF Transcript_3033/g.4169 Transcript_3033/m.4169 type:complete len:316 (+) Transcript_3033:114-1061(+)
MTSIVGMLLLAVGALAFSSSAFHVPSVTQSHHRYHQRTKRPAFWWTRAKYGSSSSRGSTLVAATTTTTDPGTISLVECEGSPDDIMDAATHMVDCFWLNSPQSLLVSADDGATVDSNVRANLVDHQAQDLTEQFGERLGKRQLDTTLIKAVMMADEGTVGMVCVDVRLMDESSSSIPQILGAVQSEQMLKNTVASLGPKQRRQYKDASAQEIAKQLLPPTLVPIVLLSNLSVSPKARRVGLAQRLCEDAERVAKSWGYTELHLKVEAGNEAARSLYETKMKFVQQAVLKDEAAIRVDGDTFVEVQADTLLLSKKL